MPVKNPSFEDYAYPTGTPNFWTVDDATAHVEVAEFGPRLGFDRFERDWRLPRGQSMQDGDLTDSYVWASILNGVKDYADPPSADFILNAAAVITIGTVPGGGVEVYLQYTNEDGVGGRVASVIVPEGATIGTQWQFTLQADDSGITAINNITTSPVLPTTEVAVIGSWFLDPRNEAAVFEFDTTPTTGHLIPASYDGNPDEGFEAGWGNDGGFRSIFEALNSAVAAFALAADGFENFEATWKLPLSGGSPFNEETTRSFEGYIDNIASPQYAIDEGATDRIAFEIDAGGTTTPITLQLTEGLYTPATLAAHMEAVIGAALDADLGSANSGHVTVTALSDGTLRIENVLPAVMRLLEPATDSAWVELQFVTGAPSERAASSYWLEVGAATPDTFETDWRSNQDSVYTFPDDPGLQSAAADFGGPLPRTPETFESGWVTTL